MAWWSIKIGDHYSFNLRQPLMACQIREVKATAYIQAQIRPMTDIEL